MIIKKTSKKKSGARESDKKLERSRKLDDDGETRREDKRRVNLCGMFLQAVPHRRCRRVDAEAGTENDEKSNENRWFVISDGLLDSREHSCTR